MPLIIYGTRGITYGAGSGDFHCPTCQTEKAYKQKRVRRFFTLYWIPLIPLDLIGEYVECQNCESTYNEKVLEFDPSAAQAEFEAEFHRAVRRVMVLMMLADGNIDDDEREVIRNIFSQLTDRQATDQELDGEIAFVQKTGVTAADTLGDMAGTLNDKGKHLVLRAAIHVAAADGHFAEEEKALLAEVAGILQVEGDTLGQILDDMLAG